MHLDVLLSDIISHLIHLEGIFLSGTMGHQHIDVPSRLITNFKSININYFADDADDKRFHSKIVL